METPRIHSNGTHPRDLLEQQLTARKAVLDAMKAIEGACPNGRDYYPQGLGSHERALHEHTQRIEKLKSVYREYTELADHIAKHLDTRAPI